MGHLLMTSCSGRFHSGPSLRLLAFFVLLEASPPIPQNGLPEPGFVRLNPDSLPCVSQFPVLSPAVSWVLNIRFPLKTEESQPLTCCPPSHRRSHCFIRTSRWISRNGAVGLSWELDACLTPPGLSFCLIFGWPSLCLEQGSLVASAVLWLTFFFLSCCLSRAAGLSHLESEHFFTGSHRVLPRTPCNPVN